MGLLYCVCVLLGRSSRSQANFISKQLRNFRLSLKNGDLAKAEQIYICLNSVILERLLNIFVTGGRGANISSWVYILSTYETRKIFEIGMTHRSVEERVKEINAASGVVVPWGNTRFMASGRACSS